MSATVLRELADLRTRSQGRDRYADLLLRLCRKAPDDSARLDLFERIERNLTEWRRQEDRIAFLLDQLAAEHRPIAVGWPTAGVRT